VARRSRPRAEPAQRRRRLLLSVSRGGKAPTVSRIARKACGVACVRHGSAWTLAATPASTPASTATRTNGGARGRVRPRARLRAPGLPPRSREKAFGLSLARARSCASSARRSSADGRPSRPSTPAPVRADRVRHAAGAARRTKE
jgi:hypothetical protein